MAMQVRPVIHKAWPTGTNTSCPTKNEWEKLIDTAFKIASDRVASIVSDKTWAWFCRKGLIKCSFAKKNCKKHQVAHRGIRFSPKPRKMRFYELFWGVAGALGRFLACHMGCPRNRRFFRSVIAGKDPGEEGGQKDEAASVDTAEADTKEKSANRKFPRIDGAEVIGGDETDSDAALYCDNLKRQKKIFKWARRCHSRKTMEISAEKIWDLRTGHGSHPDETTAMIVELEQHYQQEYEEEPSKKKGRTTVSI